MATIRPFCGLRYVNEDLTSLVAPPYDVLSEAERNELASKSPHNIVHLTLPESKPDDRSKFVKYARSAALLNDWKSQGVLKKEDTPALYRYIQHFDIPGQGRLSRQSLIVTLKVQPYADGVVLPHEQTFPKHKEDRLRILEATRAHLECIYGLYEDPGRQIFDLVNEAKASHTTKVTTDDGVEHILEVIQDPEFIEQILGHIAPQKLWIADGHHRYETALNFRQMTRNEDPGVFAEDFMMMAIGSMEDPGLVLLPTHRILKKAPEDLVAKLAADYWRLSPCANVDLMPTIERLAAEGKRAFGIALPGGQGHILEVTHPELLRAQISEDASDHLKDLDVTALHSVIFAKHLGLTGLDFFGYTRDENEALEAVENGAPASFLMNPPTVHDMRVISGSGEKMPQKSTYYYPKILSGLVLWSLSDFQ